MKQAGLCCKIFFDCFYYWHIVFNYLLKWNFSMKHLFLLIVAFGVCLLPGNSFFAAGPPAGQMFLDLPNGIGQTETEDEEKTPPIIEFYDNLYEGEAFFFLLDRSSSMAASASVGGTKFDVLQREVIQAIQKMNKDTVCSICYFNHAGPLIYGQPPVKMDAAGKAVLIGNVSQTQVSHGSFICNAAKKFFQIINADSHEMRTIIYVGDGGHRQSSDDQAFNLIMQQNPERVPINGIYIGGDSTAKPEFVKRLCKATNGKYSVASD
jgi:hypothetical protein